jgi:hypothetical protein
LIDRRKMKTGLEERKLTNRDGLIVNANAKNNEYLMTSEKKNDKKDTSDGGVKTGIETDTGTVIAVVIAAVTAAAPATGIASEIVLLTIARPAACLLGLGMLNVRSQSPPRTRLQPQSTKSH